MRCSFVRLVVPIVVLLAAIACGGGPAPKGASAPLPAASDSVAVVSLLVPGTPQRNWNTVNRALTDSSYRFADGDFWQGVIRVRSLVEGRLIQVEMSPAGPESVTVRITGRDYVGTGRTETILASEAAWPETRSSSVNSRNLLTAAARIRMALAPAASTTTTSAAAPRQMGPLLYLSPDSLLRDIGGGRRGYCKANTVMRDLLLTVDNVSLADWCTLPASEAARTAYNTYVLQDPDSTRVGHTVEVCSYSPVPRGFEILEWFTDRARCPFDPWWVWKAEPNMMRLKRWQ